MHVLTAGVFPQRVHLEFWLTQPLGLLCVYHSHPFAMKMFRLSLIALTLCILPHANAHAQSESEAPIEPLATIDASFSRSDLGVLQAELAEIGIAFRYENMDFLNGKLVGLVVSFRRIDAEAGSMQTVKGYYSFTGVACKLRLLGGADADGPLQLASNC